MSLACESLLRDRAQLLKKVRAFFDERGILEVDTPLLSPFAPIDTHIDLFEVKLSETQIGYLHSSPEYGMKRLLSEGSGDIYQLSHVYRKGEYGKLHSPVFTLIEWYRINSNYSSFIEETLDLFCLFLGPLPHETLTYQTAFQKFLQIDPFNTSITTLLEAAQNHNLHLKEQPINSLLNELWGCLIEPQLGQKILTIIHDYPASQAALAQTIEKQGLHIAERFEIYYQGIELANGYHELRDAEEQRRRLEQANRERQSLKKSPLPLDPHFLAALENLPDCYGIAVGFDRLMMLRHKLTEIHSTLALPMNLSH